MLDESFSSADRFSAYVDELVSVIGHADRAQPLRDYCLGLMLPCARKSVEPMAALTAPERTAAQHQSLLHFVGEAPGRTIGFFRKCARWFCPSWKNRGLSKLGSSTTQAFPRRANIPSVSPGNIAGNGANRIIAKWLCLCHWPTMVPVCLWRISYICPRTGPQMGRDAIKTKVPDEIVFKTKPEIALEQLRSACEAGLPRGVVLMDAGYGASTDLREQMTGLGLTYIGGHFISNQRVARRYRSSACQSLVWPGTANQTVTPCCGSSTGLGQRSRFELAGLGLAHNPLARGNKR